MPATTAKKLIKNVFIVNEGHIFKGDVLVDGEYIDKVSEAPIPIDHPEQKIEIIDAEGLYLLPGVIDDQVHFREPGLTHKGEIATESKAAVAGGVTSFMDMPNCKPPSLTITDLEKRYARAAITSMANYSFYYLAPEFGAVPFY